MATLHDFGSVFRLPSDTFHNFMVMALGSRVKWPKAYVGFY